MRHDAIRQKQFRTFSNDDDFGEQLQFAKSNRQHVGSVNIVNVNVVNVVDDIKVDEERRIVADPTRGSGINAIKRTLLSMAVPASVTSCSIISKSCPIISKVDQLFQKLTNYFKS